jgi:very-short-patch-repair endonuclease
MEILNKQQFKRHIHKHIKEKDSYERRILLDSKWEETLFDELRFKKFMPDTQIPVGPYFIDMGYPSKKIGIEVDSEWWHKDIGKDIERQNFIKKKGWEIIRITGEDIKENVEKIANGIISQVEFNGIADRFIGISKNNMCIWDKN